MTSTPARQAEALVVARSADVAEGGRYVVTVDDDLEIGLFRFRDTVYAYENTCPHQGGPVCQGRLVNGVRERLDYAGRSVGLRFDDGDPHIVCPWHGVEYRLTTGAHPGLSGFRLRGFDVVEVDGEIRVEL